MRCLIIEANHGQLKQCGKVVRILPDMRVSEEASVPQTSSGFDAKMHWKVEMNEFQWVFKKLIMLIKLIRVDLTERDCKVEIWVQNAAVCIQYNLLTHACIFWTNGNLQKY